MGFSVTWNSTCWKCNLVTKGLDKFMGCKIHKGNVFRAWGVGQRQNLLFSCIIHFISLSIHTSPRVKQRRRKKDKGKPQRNKEETTGGTEYSDNPKWQPWSSPMIPMATGWVEHLFSQHQISLWQHWRGAIPKGNLYPHFILYTKLLRILVNPTGHLSPLGDVFTAFIKWVT